MMNAPQLMAIFCSGLTKFFAVCVLRVAPPLLYPLAHWSFLQPLAWRVAYRTLIARVLQPARFSPLGLMRPNAQAQMPYIEEVRALGAIAGQGLACGSSKYDTFEMLARAILLTKSPSD